MSLGNINSLYLAYLTKYPLVTKSITAGTLNGLNELISSLISKDYSSFKGYNNKVVKMIIYGSLILTPLSHNLYGLLNTVFKATGGKKLSLILKLGQILTSMLTITPIISGVFTSWLSLINNYHLSHKKFPSVMEKFKFEVSQAITVVGDGLAKNYGRNVKSSMITNGVCLVIAQNFLHPELWVVFFNVIYFGLGTYQNVKQKLNKASATHDDKSGDKDPVLDADSLHQSHHRMKQD